VSETKELLRRGVGGFEPMPDAFERVLARRDRKQRNQRLAAGVLGIAVFAVAAIGLVRLLGTETHPAVDPDSPFLGTWVSTSDADGGTQTMAVRASADGFEIESHDDIATVCSGTPSTMIGTGALDPTGALVIPEPDYTCDDGSEPQALSGPPLVEQLQNLTFVLDPETETLTDNFGGVWLREGADDPSPSEDPTADLEPLWPQTSVEEAQRAQRLADEGDPRYTWQVLPEWPPYGPGGIPEMEPGDAEIFVRFLQQELGWEEFSWGVGTSVYPPPDWPWDFVVVRCAPGRTNALYPNDRDGRECAPTIDGHRYETARIGAEPLRTDDPSAIWVVTRWVMLPPSDDPITGAVDFLIRSPIEQQVEQVAPPSDAEATAIMRAFLQARVAGEGAEQYLHPDAEQVVAQTCEVHTTASCGRIPLLYATTSDAPYERFEFELVQGPVWPGGWTEFTVRLFAESGRIVVEQPFIVDRAQDGRLGLVYGTLADENVQTTENGEVLGVPYSLLDGGVIFAAASPWYEFFDYGSETIALVNGGDPGDFAVLADPLPLETGCRQGRAPADAESLARSIRSDSDLEATEPVTVGVGGIEALRMDVVAAPGATVCEYWGTPLVVSGPRSRDPQGPGLVQGDRMRLYLLDLPEGSSARILAIAIVAPEPSFETVLEQATRIVDSFEFRAG
jgi:hypothetical protein